MAVDPLSRLQDPLEHFAEVERLVSKVYFRFSHLFLHRPELRDFWWQMATEEEQHACILLACRAIVEKIPDVQDPGVGREKVDGMREQMDSYLRRGTPSLTMDEAFRIAMDIESSEVDAIYTRLLRACGPNVAKLLENVGVPASIQRHKLKSTILRLSADPGVRAQAEKL